MTPNDLPLSFDHLTEDSQLILEPIVNDIKELNSDRPVIKSGQLRKHYYETSDALFALSANAAELEDDQFRRDVYMLMQKLDDVHDHLTKNYTWD
jgi:hypothetical protein